MIRKLSVYSCFRERKKAPGGNILIPQIKMEGKWLEKAGFQPGDKLHIETINGMIIIEKVNPHVEIQQSIIKQFVLNL